VAAQITELKLEGDSDIHLVLFDAGCDGDQVRVRLQRVT
jgi:hypothetical protein